MLRHGKRFAETPTPDRNSSKKVRTPGALVPLQGFACIAAKPTDAHVPSHFLDAHLICTKHFLASHVVVPFQIQFVLHASSYSKRSLIGLNIVESVFAACPMERV